MTVGISRIIPCCEATPEALLAFGMSTPSQPFMANTPTTHVLYLHGFRSSPQSTKARQVAAVMGSSLGGFYATWLAAQRGCKAVLLNPAIHPARDLTKYIGEQTAWHDPAERFFFAPEFVDELSDLEVGPLPRPERLWALIAKGDEVLDWREMTARYPGSHQVVMEGGDHAISNFETYLPQVLEFLDLQTAP